MEAGFAAEQRELSNVVIVDLRGEIDLSMADRLRAVLALAGQVGRPIIVNLRKVSFADSTCLSALIELSNSLAESGGLVVVAEPGRQVQKVFEITHLAETFGLSESDQAAEASFDLTHVSRGNAAVPGR